MTNVSIINAPDDVNFEADAGVWPPLGSLRVALSAKNLGANVIFIDGQHHTSLDDVIRQVDPDTKIAGITFNRVTMPTVRPLIQGLLEKGVKQIVVGGQAVIPIAETFVSDLADLRVMACYGDGEPTIKGLVKGDDLSEIPNLTFFDGSTVRKTSEQLIDYTSLGVLRYAQIEGFDWQNYFKISHKVFDDGKNRASVYFADGCPRRIKKGCSFCARRNTGVIRTMSPKDAYNQLLHLKEKGADTVNIESDTFFSDIHFLEELANIMESRGNLRLGLDVYGGVSELNQKSLNLAERLGVSSILVGVESGNKEIRRINGKYFTDKRMFETAEECRKRGIRYDPAFVLGMIGETDETAIETVGVARKLVSKGYCNKVYASLFMPFPGSPAYDLIQKKLQSSPALNEKFGYQFNRWDYDWSKLIDAQVEIMTSTSRKHLCSCLDKMKNFGNYARPVMGNYSVSEGD
ncbi:MAG: radical SAM protein [Nanoarchaeota archaeon]|nr:radical SAM protein [Nanoarchaeota archaeon]